MSKHLNLSGRIRLASSAPSNPIQGDEYYNTTDNALMRYDGTHWRGFTLGTTTTSTSTTTTSTSTSTTTTISTSTSTSTTTTSTSTSTTTS